jgi:hypothetical protein
VQNRSTYNIPTPSGSGLESGNLEYGFGFVSGSESWRAKSVTAALLIRIPTSLKNQQMDDIVNTLVTHTLFADKNIFGKFFLT